MGHICTAIVRGIPIPLELSAVSFTRSRRSSQVAGFSPSCATLASGVGQSPSPVSTLIRDEPEPITDMRGTEGDSRYAIPLRVIPARGQVSKHSSESSMSESWNVLHEHVSGSKLTNDPSELGPKTRAGSGDPGTLAGETEVLAGKAAADDIDVWHRHRHHFPKCGF